MKKNKFLHISILFLLCLLSVGQPCFAGGALELNYPTIGGQTLSVNTDLPQLVQYVFYLALAISGLLAFGVLIYAGIRLLTSGGNPGAMNDAKDQIFSAFVGLIILLCSYIILTTINPDLINIETPNIQSQTTTK